MHFSMHVWRARALFSAKLAKAVGWSGAVFLVVASSIIWIGTDAGAATSHRSVAPNTCGAGTHTLISGGTTLGKGTTFYTPNCAYHLSMQFTGNLVWYSGSTALWQSHTYITGYKGDYAVMQTTGNLVVYNSTPKSLWSTQTEKYSGAHLWLQNTGNLVVYNSAQTAALWAESWQHTVSGSKSYAKTIMSVFGWGSTQWPYLTALWTRESNWQWNATNAASHAYGIPQSLPANKMITYGPNYLTTGMTQIDWGEDYIYNNYSTPEAAYTYDVHHTGYAPIQ